MPAISAVRMPLILVCSPRRRGTVGAGWRGGAEPLAEAGGRVVAEACGAADSVMALLPLRTGTGAQVTRLPLRTRVPARTGLVSPDISRPTLHWNLKTSNIFLE